MNAKVEKFLVMPIVLPITPNTLVLPGTKPLYPQQQVVGGAIRWSAPEWNKAEYERVQNKINAISAKGIDIEVFVMKLAEMMSQLLPDREFSVQIGSFMVEYKPIKFYG
jgi:hypothetical protein